MIPVAFVAVCSVVSALAGIVLGVTLVRLAKPVIEKAPTGWPCDEPGDRYAVHIDGPSIRVYRWTSRDAYWWQILHQQWTGE